MKEQELQMGDCMDHLPSYPDNYFDLAIIDLPQGNSEAKRIASKSDRVYGKTVIPRGSYKSKDWDDVRTGPEYFSELFRVSRFQIIFCAIYYTDLLPPSRGWIVWNKCNGTTSFGDCELAWSNFDKPVRKVDFMWNGHQQGRSLKNGTIQKGDKKKNEKRIHPTQKPVKLYEWLLSNYAEQGWRILDTHVGSGSSLIACHQAGFEYVGFEKDKDYFEAASKRLRLISNQHVLF